MKKLSVSKSKICVAVLAVALLISVGLNLLQAFNPESYLQNTGEIYIMEAGILLSSLELR